MPWGSCECGLSYSVGSSDQIQVGGRPSLYLLNHLNSSFLEMLKKIVMVWFGIFLFHTVKCGRGKLRKELLSMNEPELEDLEKS